MDRQSCHDFSLIAVTELLKNSVVRAERKWAQLCTGFYLGISRAMRQNSTKGQAMSGLWPRISPTVRLGFAAGSSLGKLL